MNFLTDDSIFRIMMERLCCVSAFGDEKQAKENVEKKNYILPCGTNITLHEERIMAPEILFYPKLLGGKLILTSHMEGCNIEPSLWKQ